MHKHATRHNTIQTHNTNNTQYKKKHGTKYANTKKKHTENNTNKAQST